MASHICYLYTYIYIYVFTLLRDASPETASPRRRLHFMEDLLPTLLHLWPESAEKGQFIWRLSLEQRALGIVFCSLAAPSHSVP